MPDDKITTNDTNFIVVDANADLTDISDLVQEAMLICVVPHDYDPNDYLHLHDQSSARRTLHVIAENTGLLIPDRIKVMWHWIDQALNEQNNVLFTCFNKSMTNACMGIAREKGFKVINRRA